MTHPVALVLRALGLGDLLTAVPALRGLRAALPAHRIVLAAPAPLAGLVATIDAVDALHPTRELAPIRWPGPRPQMAVNLHGRGPQTHRLLLDARPERMVGFARPDLGLDGPEWEDDEHERHRWCRLVTHTWGVPTDPDDVLLSPPPVAKAVEGAAVIRVPPDTADVHGPPPAAVVPRGAVVVHPGAAAASRRWPADRFAVVARWLRDEGLPVVVTGSAGERPLAERVRRLAGLSEGANLAGRTDLVTLAALVTSARIVVSNDTGVAHLAAAYRVPSVVLFGPTPPHLWGPPAAGPHVALWTGAGLSVSGNGRGDPHGHQLDPRLDRIQSPEVIAAAAPLLARAVRAPSDGAR